MYQLLITVSMYVVFGLTNASASVAFKRCVHRGHELSILYRQFSSRQLFLQALFEIAGRPGAELDKN